MSITFRWAAWGDKRGIIEMLCRSIDTFQRTFRNEARYAITTDEPSELRSLLFDRVVDILPFSTNGPVLFDVNYSTWRKWCPNARLCPDSTEFYVDSDVFLLGDPIELRRFAARSTAPRFIVMQEGVGQRHCIGGFGTRILKGIPPVNAGLIGQAPGADLTEELFVELQWWLANVPVEARHYHDDQGAVVAVLARWYLLGQVELLPQDRYFIFGEETKNRTLDGIVALHATRRTHPAYRRFRAEIEKYIHEGAKTDREFSQ